MADMLGDVDDTDEVLEMLAPKPYRKMLQRLRAGPEPAPEEPIVITDTKPFCKVDNPEQVQDYMWALEVEGDDQFDALIEAGFTDRLIFVRKSNRLKTFPKDVDAIGAIVGSESRLHVFNETGVAKRSEHVVLKYSDFAEIFKRPPGRRRARLNVLSYFANEYGNRRGLLDYKMPDVLEERKWSRKYSEPHRTREYNGVIMSHGRCTTNAHIDSEGAAIWTGCTVGSKTFQFVKPSMVLFQQYQYLSHQKVDDRKFMEQTMKANDVYEKELTAMSAFYMPPCTLHRVVTNEPTIMFNAVFLTDSSMPWIAPWLQMSTFLRVVGEEDPVLVQDLRQQLENIAGHLAHTEEMTTSEVKMAKVMVEHKKAICNSNDMKGGWADLATVIDRINLPYAPMKWTCPKCKQDYSYRASLARHQREAHNVTMNNRQAKLYKCPRGPCIARYANLTALNLHIAGVHDGKTATAPGSSSKASISEGKAASIGGKVASSGGKAASSGGGSTPSRVRTRSANVKGSKASSSDGGSKREQPGEDADSSSEEVEFK
jgi:hypothetical protein